MKLIPYRELIGKLLYLAVAMSPDVAYTVSVLCRFGESGPGPLVHREGYLKGTVHMKPVYCRTTSPDRFATYSDADLRGYNNM